MALLPVSLLDLTPELKFRIFEYYTASPQAYLCHRRGSTSSSASYWRFWLEDPNDREIRLSVLRVCHRLRSELRSFLASRSTLKITTDPFNTLLTPAAMSVLPQEYIQHVRTIECDQSLSIDVVRFFPSLQTILLRCSVTRILSDIIKQPRWTKPVLESKVVRDFVQEDMTSLFEEERLNITRLARGREIELELARYYGKYTYRTHQTRTSGKVLDARAKRKGGVDGKCDVEINLTKDFELHLLTPSSPLIVFE